MPLGSIEDHHVVGMSQGSADVYENAHDSPIARLLYGSLHVIAEGNNANDLSAHASM